MRVTVRNLQRKIGLDTRDLKRRLQGLGRVLGLTGAELSVVLVGDRKIRQLNRVYRSVDKTTDVLSFPQYTSLKEIKRQKGEVLLGDVVINLHLASTRAAEEGRSLEEETYRLVVHGLLHLLGYDHERDRRQEALMRKKEEELLRALKEMD